MAEDAYAQGFDEHVSYMVQSVMAAHGEWPTQSHLAWLHRMYSRVLLRQLELDRREQDLARREAAFQRPARKSRRGKNGGAIPDPAHAARPDGAGHAADQVAGQSTESSA